MRNGWKVNDIEWQRLQNAGVTEKVLTDAISSSTLKVKTVNFMPTEHNEVI